ncbi:hypothetical protein F4802DRAFT_332529 [Xylaria palmicola]|nr:hypothetical protein F4802DRAFT_332529 [Xylaria palmicola]
MDMFSSNPAPANFKGLRRKVANDISPPALHMTRPSTATSIDHYHSHSITDLLEPALDGPPSPEGIRAFSRRMKRGSLSEQQLNEPATSSGSSSLRSETREPSWEQGPENFSLSRNSSQRSSVMPFKDRPESVQLFGKAVFSRKPKLRRGNSDQANPNSSLVSLTEIPMDSAPELPKEQRFIQSIFTRRRTRGASEASMKKYQISGPYDFQHVSHRSKENVPDLDEVNRHEALLSNSVLQPRPKTGASITSRGLNAQTLDKPLPTPPSSHQDLEPIPSPGSVQFSPPRLPRSVPGDAQTSPITPPPRTSSRISLRHDRTDSFSTTTTERERTNSISQAKPFVLPSLNGPTPSAISHPSNGFSGSHVVGDDDKPPYSFSSMAHDALWPLNGSMTSLPEVPEEDEYHLTTITSRASVISTTTSLRGSVSVPHLRRVSLSQATPRPPSNASETLGRFDLFAAQRALHEYDDESVYENHFIQESWEDDIDYCYDHAAEADCDFAWERPSCDLEQENRFPDGPLSGRSVEPSLGCFEHVPASLLSVDLPALSPTSYGSGATQHGASTPTNLTPITSNFSLPRIDSSTQLKRDHDRSHSSASSFQEGQGFCLSPSLFIPNDYHEKMLQFERGGLSSHSSSDELNLLQNEESNVRLLHPRSSASTTVSTLSEHSVTSSRYPSSTFTRWTGSSSSSWQAHVDPQQPVTITLNDKEPIVTPTTDLAVMKLGEPMAVVSKQEAGRDGHNRAQSEATLLVKVPHDTAASLGSKVTQEPLKTHRRARTASRSHANASPQLALFPQISPRP